jgi:hypothetical protein
LIHPAFLQNSRQVSDEVIDQVSDEDIEALRQVLGEAVLCYWIRYTGNAAAE